MVLSDHCRKKNKMNFITYLYTCKHYFLTVVIFISKNVALDLKDKLYISIVYLLVTIYNK